MKVTAIACLATLAAVIGADSTPSTPGNASATSSTAGTGAPSIDSQVRDVPKRSSEAERSRDYAKGIAALLEQYDTHRGNYALNLRLGWLNYLSGKNDEAERYYQAAMEAWPASIDAKLGCLLPLLAAARYAEGEAVARQIVAVDPGNYYGNLRLAVTLRMQKKHAAADAVVERMLAAYPTDVYWLNERGQLGLAQGKKESAKEAFENVLALDPDNLTATQGLQGL